MTGTFTFTFYDWFDGQTENPVKLMLPGKEAARVFTTRKFERDGVEYVVKDAHVWEEDRRGVALVKMVRYHVPNTTTQFVHRCPARARLTTKMTRQDVTRIDSKVGRAIRKPWKLATNDRVKMSGHNRLEMRCPHCGVVFWKEAIELPDTVEVDGVMKKKAG